MSGNVIYHPELVLMELHALRPGHGGFMIAQGKECPVVFLRGALPGERVLARITEQTRSYWRAEVETIIEANPLRIPNTCSAALAGAGCCDYPFTTPDYVRTMKATVASEFLQRIAHLDCDVNIVPLLPDESGWRLRARLAIAPTSKGNFPSPPGIFAYRSTHIIPRYDCKQYDQRIIDTVAQVYPGDVSHWYTEDQWDPIAGFADKSVRTSFPMGTIQHSPTQRKHGISAAKDSQNNSQAIRLHLIVDDSNYCHAALTDGKNICPLTSKPAVNFTIAGMPFMIPTTSFWQPHKQACSSYSALLSQWLAEYNISPQVVWDLYSGAGVFAQTVRSLNPQALIAAVDTSVSVQHIDPSILSLCTTVENAIRSTDQFSTMVEKSLKSLQRNGNGVSFNNGTAAKAYLHPDLVIVDPPRKGIAKKLATCIVGYHPEWIIHWGCDMAAFARDLSIYMHGNAYQLQDLQFFDAFPGTDHLEGVALLHRVNHEIQFG